ncbi:MAG: replication-relaxation family protein [Verrucomicrobiales bacterium]
MSKIILQNRDIGLLISLAETGALSILQISHLHFQGRKEAASKRLQKLQRGGLITRVPNLQGGFGLSKKSRSVLTSHGFKPKSCPNSYQWEHHQMMMDVKMAIESTFPALCPQVNCSPQSFNIHDRVIKPDLTATYTFDGCERHYFVEVDRGTEALRVINEKVDGYARLLRKIEREPAVAKKNLLFVVLTEGRKILLARAFGSLPQSIFQKIVLISLEDLKLGRWYPFGRNLSKGRPLFVPEL